MYAHTCPHTNFQNDFQRYFGHSKIPATTAMPDIMLSISVMIKRVLVLYHVCDISNKCWPILE